MPSDLQEEYTLSSSQIHATLVTFNAVRQGSLPCNLLVSLCPSREPREPVRVDHQMSLPYIWLIPSCPQEIQPLRNLESSLVQEDLGI